MEQQLVFFIIILYYNLGIIANNKIIVWVFITNIMLINLQDIFVHLCTVDDSLYFMCNTEGFKFLAEMIQHVPLPLRARYVFCCAPINNKLPFVCATFLKVSSFFLKKCVKLFFFSRNVLHCFFSQEMC